MKIIDITDFNAPELDIYARTTENQLLNRHEPDKGIFIAESPYIISCALDSGCQPISLLCEKSMLEHDVLRRLSDIPIYTADSDILTGITGFKLTLGMLCAMKRPAPKSVKELCKSALRIAVLEHIMNPTNIGAIIRSAAALGFDAVLLSDDCSDPLYRRAARVSMGSVFQIPWAYFDKGESYKNIEFLNSVDFKTVAMALTDDSISIDDKRISEYEKLAIVLGSEGEGLTKKTIETCDHTVKIPMYHGVDSLNVAAASAVAFWELRKR